MTDAHESRALRGADGIVAMLLILLLVTGLVWALGFLGVLGVQLAGLPVPGWLVISAIPGLLISVGMIWLSARQILRRHRA
ncbi:hypothetical protein [Nesterenkonia sp. F]|uniref:hypothetical protein n=1 Tax=Nesterenkonia sp. F TaxID=795955 RepID=UPI000255C7F2|nr:hypothetical protein [Nesterenkonia sp. F]